MFQCTIAGMKESPKECGRGRIKGFPGTVKGFRLALCMLVILGFCGGCGPGDPQGKPGAPVPFPSLSQANSVEDREARMAWLLMTTLESYLNAGHRSPAWDQPATNALIAFARTIMGGDYVRTNDPVTLWKAVPEAMEAGCDDPLIQYLYIRNHLYNVMPDNDYADKWYDVAMALEQSQHHPIRKFYASSRAYQTTWKRKPLDKPSQRAIYEGGWNSLHHCLTNAATPAEEMHNACTTWIETISNRNVNDYFQRRILPNVMRRWSNTVAGQLVLANFYKGYAWNARGGGFANEVSKEGWELFFDRMRKAEHILTNIWTQYPGENRVPDLMLPVALSLQYERPEMERWFKRAMALSPNNAMACRHKLNYLEPKWYGTPGDMLAFGRQCVDSEVWGGQVPLILLDAHQAIANYEKDPGKRNQYWKSSVVWTDIERSFEKFFKLNPEAVGWRHNYALYAYRCGAWKTFLDQVDLMPQINYLYFGGTNEFQQMVVSAQGNLEPEKVD